MGRTLTQVLDHNNFCPDCGDQLAGREMIDDLRAGYAGDGELRVCLNEDCPGLGVFGVTDEGVLF